MTKANEVWVVEGRMNDGAWVPMVGRAHDTRGDALAEIRDWMAEGGRLNRADWRNRRRLRAVKYRATR